MAEQEMEFCKRCRIPKNLCPKACDIKIVEVERKILPQGTILHQDYQIYGVLGAGGMSVTYCACTRLKPVVLKQFNPNLENRKELNMEKEREKFGEEARKLLQLDHPNIVHIENIIEDEESKDVFLVMELLYGETLEKYLQGLQEPMPEQKAYQMLAPIFDALETVHQARIIHRDIKPSNIMLCIDGTIKLIDFGSARQEDNYTKTALLTEGYAPPEQYEEHGNQGTWTDVYSMCATLYRMVTGKKPPASWSRYRKDTIEIPKGLKHREELKKGLALEAEDRWQTVEELQAALGISSLTENIKYVAKKSLKRAAEVAGEKIVEGFEFDRVQVDTDESESCQRDASWERKTKIISDKEEENGEQETEYVPRKISDHSEDVNGVNEELPDKDAISEESIDSGCEEKTKYFDVNKEPTRRVELHSEENGNELQDDAQARTSEQAEKWCKLGNAYYYGEGVETDYVQAFAWYDKAVRANVIEKDSKALCALGDYYYYGYGTTIDKSKAYSWYDKAANAGNARAMYLLGDYYYYGYGTKIDKNKAYIWYDKAANAGNAEAMNAVGDCYYYGDGVIANKREAFNWYKMAARADNAEAMRNLGWCYQHGGSGIIIDEKQAFYWYTKAEQNGNKKAKNDLGDCFYYGKGVAMDKKIAFKWYSEAAQAKISEAMYNLGWCYQYGHGTNKDTKQAVYWYFNAASMGNKHGMEKTSACYRHGIGVAKDKKLADYWKKKANGTLS